MARFWCQKLKNTNISLDFSGILCNDRYPKESKTNIFIPQVLRATLIMPKEPLSRLFRVQVGMFHISCFIASFFLMVLPFHLGSHRYFVLVSLYLKLLFK